MAKFDTFCSPEPLAVPPSRCLTSNAFIASSRGLYFFVASALTTNSPLESIAGIESDLADPGPATGPPEAKRLKPSFLLIVSAATVSAI